MFAIGTRDVANCSVSFSYNHVIYGDNISKIVVKCTRVAPNRGAVGAEKSNSGGANVHQSKVP